jgi:formamidopyrimidine-DNA glycosylase
LPELPEVESVAAALRLNLLGRRFTGLRVRFGGVFADRPRRVRRALRDRTLIDVHRHGKYLIMNFAGDVAAAASGPADPVSRGGAGLVRDGRSGADGSRGETHLMLHLRMTGQLLCLPDYRPDKHVHATLDFDGRRVHYRDMRKFGRFQLVEDGRRPAAIAHVGPDVLEVRFAKWYERIADRRAPIKALLLDQGIAAGLGNIYVDEALFRAGVHPTTPAAALDRDELRAILRCSKDVLRLAIRHGGTTFVNFTNFHGKPGNFRRKLRAYGRTGEPCLRCHTPLERLVVGGRSSHFCPRCQPAR